MGGCGEGEERYCRGGYVDGGRIGGRNEGVTQKREGEREGNYERGGEREVREREEEWKELGELQGRGEKR